MGNQTKLNHNIIFKKEALHDFDLLKVVFVDLI